MPGLFAGKAAEPCLRGGPARKPGRRVAFGAFAANSCYDEDEAKCNAG